MDILLRKHATPRHATAYAEQGPPEGPLMVFVHGWPELGRVWRAQMAHFAAAGWRCVAPDMRGYGDSAAPAQTGAYAMAELVADMVELHDALGAAPAVWVGHDWGCPVIASLAAAHPQRCRAIACLSVPVFPQGFALANLVPLVDRTLYPAEHCPDGQWDYFRFYQTHFEQAAADLEADVAATLASILRRGSPDNIGKPAPTAEVTRRGGRFGAAHRAPAMPPDPGLVPAADFEAWVAAFTKTGFRPADAWYVNDAANIAYARSLPAGGRLPLPVLYINGAWDTICDITRSRLGEPMRAACADLTVVDLPGGHWLPLECKAEVNAALARWIADRQLGPAAGPSADEALTPFRIEVPQERLDDLQRRLDAVRWPDPGPVDDWSQGAPLAAAQALVEHWRTRYDWRRLEARANAHAQWRTRLDGLGFHFFHVRSPEPGALPLLLTHGWPGSFVEFLDVVGPLADPVRHGGRAQDAFHVVIPSLPGFGFSDKPTERGWDALRTARAWVTLMGRLGYERWVAQGGDWGARVVHALGRLRPPGLLAAHTNWPFVFPADKPSQPTPAEARAYGDAQDFLDRQTGYAKQQQTRPQTLGYALADSPVGQAMWIYEKFQAWTDNRGRPEDALSMDAMLDDITLYWLTDSGASSARFYLENLRPGPPSYSAGRIELPMAASIFPKEIYRPPRAWAEASWPNLFYWNEVSQGGHFAAFEQPAIFVEEMRRAFASVRATG